jgi:hypothetical protein
MNMARSLKNPNPVALAHGKAKQISDQLRGHAFCAECEDLFNKGGERWVLSNIQRDYQSGLPLQDALIPQTPTCIGGRINVYAARNIAEFDVDKMVYFGMSVFWRGAAREWRSSTGALAPPVELREYFEPIREFLLGGKFPDDVFIMTLIHNLKPPDQAVLPVLPAQGPYGSFYWFYVNGLGFELHLGGGTPLAIRNVCTAHNASGPIVVDQGFGEMIRGFIRRELNASQRSPNMLSSLGEYRRNRGNGTSSRA